MKTIKIAIFLLFGLTLSLSRVQSEPEESDSFKLASTQLSQVQDDGSPAISMDFQEAELEDILKLFSQQAGLNFIAGSQKVRDRKVTLYLDMVSVQDALDTIMSANNLTYEQEEDSKIFVVKECGKPEIETITKVFPLQYARVKGYELTATGEVATESKEIGIKEIIETLLVKDAQGKIIGGATEDPRTNSLIITDVPSQFPKIEEAIKQLDIKLPQVMIEVEVIETSLDAIDKLGIEWGTQTEGELVTAAGAARTSTYPFTKPQEMRKVGPDGNPIDVYLGYISAMDLGGTLAMLAQDTNTKILARPRILTLNNESAEIKITADTAIAALQETSSAEGIATQTQSAERVETGVTLKVTPQINTKKEITMFIEPSITNTKWSKYFSGTYVDPQTRSAKTTVAVRDGETIVLGGLIDIEDTKIARKVPILGDIPLLGYLFRKQDNQVVDKELIIFITPHLLKEGAATPELALEKKVIWEGEDSSLKEEAMEKILDQFEK